jgi:hypothetical protein
MGLKRDSKIYLTLPGTLTGLRWNAPTSTKLHTGPHVTADAWLFAHCHATEKTNIHSK